MDLLVLVGCDRSEDGLWEAERLYSFPCRNRFGWRKLAAEVFSDHVDTGLILVHRVQDDLEIKRVISSTRHNHKSAFTHLYGLNVSGIMRL